jgi:hypothetical protein
MRRGVYPFGQAPAKCGGMQDAGAQSGSNMFHLAEETVCGHLEGSNGWIRVGWNIPELCVIFRSVLYDVCRFYAVEYKYWPRV